MMKNKIQNEANQIKITVCFIDAVSIFVQLQRQERMSGWFDCSTLFFNAAYVI